MTRGWHNESQRHSLAAKGVKTARGYKARGREPMYGYSSIVTFTTPDGRTVVNSAGDAVLEGDEWFYNIPARDIHDVQTWYKVRERDLRPATIREAQQSMLYGRQYQ